MGRHEPVDYHRVSRLSDQELEALVRRVRALDEHQRYNAWECFHPYEKQMEFFALSASKHESMITAGNQQGKTLAGGFATACHLTGIYPAWWPGRRFDKPTKGWVCGETAVSARDDLQAKLCGEPGVDELFGTGMVPKHLFVDKPSLSRGVTDAYDTIQVRHASGGISIARFKSYEQGRTKFQSATLNWIWADEECPYDIYTELLARTTATDGIIYVTFSPIKGRTDLVIHYQEEQSPDRAYVRMGMKDAKHIKPEDYERQTMKYPAHERQARIEGIPMMGQGRVFPYEERLIVEPPIQYIPAHWGRLWAVDFSHGGTHPFAAVLLLHDRDNDVIHVHHAIKVVVEPGSPGGLPMNHAAQMKAVASEVPVSWPHDGQQTVGGLSTRDFETIKNQYKACGLKMLGKWATFKDGGFGTEAGIMDLDTRMQNGGLKVAAQLEPWLQEFRNYHRENGILVKKNDDLMSATRIGVMDIRHASLAPLGNFGVAGWNPNRGQDRMANGLDFDLN